MKMILFLKKIETFSIIRILLKTCNVYEKALKTSNSRDDDDNGELCMWNG